MAQGRTDKAEDSDLPLDRIGPYRLCRILGEGGMSRVFEAIQKNPLRKVAIKMIREALFSETALRRFEYEGRILAGLRHPGIARVIETGTHQSRSGAIPYLVMEYIPSAQAITEYARHASLSNKERIALFVQVCEAVHYGHGKGVIHRDLKPANIVVDEGGRVKVIDFGVARTMEADESCAAGTCTTVSRLVGTLQYMSPEQCEAVSGQLDIRSDVYALGVLLFELVTGGMPYDLKELGLVESARIIRCEPPQKPSSINSKLKGDLETIVLKALEKERHLRYQTVLELQDDLLRYLNGDVILAKPATLVTRLVKFVKRNPVLCATTGTAFLSLAAWVAYILFWSYPLLQHERDLAHTERNKALAVGRQVEEQLSRIQRLSDRLLLDELKTRERDLWPALPDKVAALEAWLSDAATLTARLVLHYKTLEAWQAQALPQDERAVQEYRESHPLFTRLRSSMAERDRIARLIQNQANAEEGAITRLETRQKELVTQIADMEAEISQKRLWDFQEVTDRWQYEQLETLIREIKSLNRGETGLLADIRLRLDRAKTIEHDSLVVHADAWEQATASISDPSACPRYQGLRMDPIIGFVPLGRDPDSGLWEFFLLHSGTLPKRDTQGRLVLAEDSGMVFVLIPGGSLTLGTVASDSDRDAFGMQTLLYNREPRYDSTVQSVGEGGLGMVSIPPFLLSKFEMTQGQWLRVCKENPSEYLPGECFGTWHTLLHPVERVAWHECVQTLFRMNLRLPTEAEWEYAARAGSDAQWSTGTEKDTLIGAADLCDLYRKTRLPNYQDAYEEWLNDGYIYHAPVGRFRANAFGLHDIHGNVWEWCLDTYRSGGTDAAGTVEGAGDDAGRKEFKVCRGGGHNSFAKDCRLSTRFSKEPDSRRNDCGLRPARSLEPERDE
ncbi:MAG: SUMF1/EgtB/PvdO family nonheme iron enzyme [Planctomycetota bacterium]